MQILSVFNSQDKQTIYAFCHKTSHKKIVNLYPLDKSG